MPLKITAVYCNFFATITKGGFPEGQPIERANSSRRKDVIFSYNFAWRNLARRSNFAGQEPNLLRAYFVREEGNFIVLAGDNRPNCFTLNKLLHHVWDCETAGTVCMHARVCVCVCT